MAIANFVPEFWSARLQRHRDSALVYAQPSVVNRDYEGEILNAGDTVNIQKVGDPTIVTYTPGTPMNAERPDGSTLALEIDKDKGFYIQMDDLDAIQVNVPLFDRFTERAGVNMAKVVDEDIATRMATDAGIKIGTTAAPKKIGNSTNDDFTLYELAVEHRRELDNVDAPDEGRWMVIPPDLEAAALLDGNFIPAGDNVQRTGLIGSIAGFDVLKTTAVPLTNGTSGNTKKCWNVLFSAGNYSTTVATQLVKIEAERLQGLFEDAVKGRNVWGGKVIEPATVGRTLVATDIAN